MGNTPLQRLENEVNLFRAWADDCDRTYQYWECDYEQWPTIRETFRFFLRECPYQKWGADTFNILLYILARDNECGELASDLAREAERLLAMARASLASDERDAKWQLAVEISRLSSHYFEVEVLLLKFVGDEDEYVRRQALMGLGRIKSPAVESLVEANWDTGHEYQRMGVLNALHHINSPHLAEFRDRAIADGGKYLVGYAQRVHLEEQD